MTREPSETEVASRVPVLSESRLWRLITLSALYFAQGVPWGFIAVGYVVFLSDQHLDNAAIGDAIGLAYVPWSFKIFAGPFLDRVASTRFGRRREQTALGGHRVDVDPGVARARVRAEGGRGLAGGHAAQGGADLRVGPPGEQRPEVRGADRGQVAPDQGRQRRVGVDHLPVAVEQDERVARPVQAGGECGLDGSRHGAPLYSASAGSCGNSLVLRASAVIFVVPW